ncbi:MAG: SGNH/GDSL hydrolase family protein [Planctomycetota bacterium]
MGTQWLARIALSTVAAAGSWLLAEVAVRVLLPPPQLVSVYAKSNYASRLEQENRSRLELTAPRPQAAGLFVATPTGRRMRANTHVRIEPNELSGLDVVVETNSLGYRNREIGPKTRRRVLFLGDSITAADYLPEECCWVRKVEQLSQSTSEPLETINAGVGGIGLQNELAILVETGLGTQPDVVVLGFYLNDVHESRGVQIVQVPRALRWSWVARHVWRAASLFTLLTGSEVQQGIPRSEWEQWFLAARKQYHPAKGDPKHEPAAFHQLLLTQFGDWGNAWYDGAWERMQPNFAELKRLAVTHQFQLLIVCFPVRPQVDADYLYDQPQRKLESVCRELAVPMLDLLPKLRAAAREDAAPLYFDQCHPTVRGSELVAAWVLEFLMAERSAP